MTVREGSRVGAYEIVALLGAGRMGEVYRARDARLGRDVAIKILPEVWLSDPERRARVDEQSPSPLEYGVAPIHGAALCMTATQFAYGSDLFVDVANVLNHANVRNATYFVDRAGRVLETTESLMPIVPSGGLMIEF
jgi:serine/threonine protein kinase